MNVYHPSQSPKPQEWLELDESIRIDLVRKSHEVSEVEFEEEQAKNIHSVIHVIVENQIALGVEPVPATMSRLIRQGLSRHEAIHAIGAVLSEDLFEILKNKHDHNFKKYRRRLDKLTAKRWNIGKW